MITKLLTKQLRSKEVLLHKNFHSMVNQAKFHNLSFLGGQDYVYGKDGRGNPILGKLSCREQDLSYRIRQEATIPRNYCGLLIKRDNSDIFRSPPKRSEEDPRYIEFVKNCTLGGANLDRTMRKALQIAQIEKRCYLVADHTNTKAEVKTLAQARADGDRPFIRVLHVDQVLNWTELDGTLVECIVSYEDQEGNSFIRYYNDEIVQDFYIDQDSENLGGAITAIGEPIAHGYTYRGQNSIPVVVLEPDFEGVAQIEALALLQKELTRWVSLRAVEGPNTLFTLTLASGVVGQSEFNNGQETDKQANLPIMTTGTDTVVLTGTDGGTFQRVGADATATVTISEVINEVIKDIYRMAGRSGGNPLATGQPQSGVSKIFDQKDLANILLALSEACEYAENQIVSLILEREYRYMPAPVFYERDFDNPSMSEASEEVEVFSNIRVPNVMKRKRIEMLRSEYFTFNEEEQNEYRIELLQLYPNTADESSDQSVSTVGEQEEPVEDDEDMTPEEGVTIEEQPSQ